MALDLGVDVLSLGAQCQELHQVDVVHQLTVLVCPVPLGLHQSDQLLEGRAVVVEQQDFLPDINQLKQQE